MKLTGPFLLASAKRHLEVCRLIFGYLYNKNPVDTVDNWTIFYHAAFEGNLDVCCLLVTQLEDKNPQMAPNGETPLHAASAKGHLEICKLILENVEDKNPADKIGQTPLHEQLPMDN